MAGVSNFRPKQVKVDGVALPPVFGGIAFEIAAGRETIVKLSINASDVTIDADGNINIATFGFEKNNKPQ